jgi:hypothetical protein
MILKEELYFNTDRDFYSTYPDTLDLTAKLIFINKISKKTITVEETIVLPNLLNRYFIFPIDNMSDFENGFYTFTLYLETEGAYVEYESGLILNELTTPDIYTNVVGDNDTVFVIPE